MSALLSVAGVSKRFRGLVAVDRANFEWREEAKPSIKDGEFLVRNLSLSCDPAQRAWMEIDTYIPKVPIGDVMLALTAGQVVESKHPGFREGELASGMFGWQDYAVSDGRGFRQQVGDVEPLFASLVLRQR